MENTASSTKKRKSAGNNGDGGKRAATATATCTAAVEDSPFQLLKRSRAEEETEKQLQVCLQVPTASIANCKDDAPVLSSAQELLSVPVSFIVRKVPSSSNNNNAAVSDLALQLHTCTNHSSEKPLLSRSEAECFCKINLLAHEIDSLTQICTQLWQTQLQCETFSQSLEAVNHPFLRPLLILLDTFQRQTPAAALPRVAAELNRVVSELQQAAATMRQCSDQNWTLAETLHDSAAAAGHCLLAAEKEKLSNVQEELCSRIEKLLARNNINNNNNNNSTSGANWAESEEQYSNLSANTARRGANGPMVSMEEYCKSIFAVERMADDAADNNISTAAAARNCDDNDEILSEPEDKAEEQKQKLKPRSSTSSTKRKSTPPSHGKESSESPSLLSHATTTRTTPSLTQPPKDATKSPGSEEKENSQQSQRSSQSASSAHRMHHRGGGGGTGAIESVLLAATRTAQEEEDDDDDDHEIMDDPGTTDSQVAAHVLSSFAATTLARSSGH